MCDIYHVPGFIGDVVEYTLSHSPSPNRPLALAGALVLQAALCSRRVRTGSIKPNIYIVGVAKPSVGKNSIRRTNKAVLRAIGYDHIMQDDFASGQAIEDTLLDTPVCLAQLDEFDTYLRAMNGSKDGATEALMRNLLKMFDTSSDILKERKKANTTGISRTVEDAHLSILGTATPKTFLETIQSRGAENGLLSRVVVFRAEDKELNFDCVVDKQLPSSIFEVASYWVKGKNREEGDGKEKGMEDCSDAWSITYDASKVIDVPRTPEAEAYWREFATNCNRKHNETDSLMDATLWGRAQEHALKFALLYACSADYLNPIITIEAIRWACEVIEGMVNSLLDDNKKYVSEKNVGTANFQAVAKYIEQHSPIQHSDLTNAMSKRSPMIHSDTVAKHVKTLESGNQIEVNGTFRSSTNPLTYTWKG